MTATQLRTLGYHVTSRCRCAARYAKLTGCSIHEAAQIFQVNAGGVHNAWSRLYPTRQQPTMDRRKSPTCTACGGTGHLAVAGECSPSEQAFRLVQSGLTVREAADRIGVTNQVVYATIKQRGRAA